jgi:hypothetical protein
MLGRADNLIIRATLAAQGISYELDRATLKSGEGF